MRGRIRQESADEFWPAYTDLLMVTCLILVLLVISFVIARHDDSLPRELEARKKRFEEGFNRAMTSERQAGQVRLYSPDGERQTITFSDQLLFDVGDARLTRPAGNLALNKVASLLASSLKPHPLFRSVQVLGHTDEDPITTPLYPSNWHLSSARATSVVYYLVGRGLPPALFSATGYAEFRPVDPDNQPITAKARKRRIEIEIRYPLDWLSAELAKMK